MAEIVPQPTPNPQAYKFTIEGHTFDSARTIGSAGEAEGTPFAGLFELPGVVSLFMTANFVTIMKEPAADWEPIVGPAKALLESAF